MVQVLECIRAHMGERPSLWSPGGLRRAQVLWGVKALQEDTEGTHAVPHI